MMIIMIIIIVQTLMMSKVCAGTLWAKKRLMTCFGEHQIRIGNWIKLSEIL